MMERVLNSLHLSRHTDVGSMRNRVVKSCFYTESHSTVCAVLHRSSCVCGCCIESLPNIAVAAVFTKDAGRALLFMEDNGVAKHPVCLCTGILTLDI